MIISIVLLNVYFPVLGISSERPKNVELKIIGFSPGTSMQLRADLIAEALRREYPDWNVKALATARASADVHKHRAEKTANFFLSLMPWPAEIEAYGPEFKKIGVDFEKLYIWFPVIPSEIKQTHFWVLRKTGLTSLKDVILKKYPLKVGLMFPSHLPMFLRLLGFYGISQKDLESWGGKIVNVNFGAPVGPELMRGGKIDAGFAWTGVPNPAFLQASDLDWHLLPLAEETELLRKVEEFEFGRTIIRAGSYPNVKKDIPTIGQIEWLASIPGKVSEEITYWVIKGIWKQREFLASGFPGFKEVLDPKFISLAVGALRTSADLGAVKFYREQGWIKK
jgi:hypothetical protein